ncbi:BNR-4 repeat-containing protein [Neiella sp. HB171785]|uniref:BNR-4 repeat-containing protein n=1 Tax=Neiella litorisoli TaxID=2771431 RepID=A0A8J6UGU5_9GAMM|nr:BNR-4 repeat-containing protein [Neiella litorisoli]MBD1390751.1 BNR-4 repeat-containing protein [Neiella litorisoli]
MQFIKLSGLVAWCTLALTACQSTSTPTDQPQTTAMVDSVEYFTDTGLSNPVATLQHPAGEYANGITYVTYQGPLEDAYVAAYNHNTKQWLGPIKAGTSAMGKDPTRKIDNHGKPALIIDDLGYIHIAFGGHGGTPEMGDNDLGNYNYGKLKHIVSKRPYDITEWQELNNVSPFGTYNQWVKTSNGDLYLFYRHGAHQSHWVYQKSTDHGRTFGERVSVMKHQKRDDGLGVDSWYGYFSEEANDTIALGYIYHRCGNNHPNGKHLGERTNGYYMQMDTNTGQWSNVQGEPIATPVTRDIANEKTLVLKTDHTDDWTGISTVHLDENGYPHIRFARGHHKNRHQGGPKKAHYYRWDGEQWLVSKTGQLPISNGDHVVHYPLKTSTLLASRAKDKSHMISWRHSVDGGKTFKKGDVVLANKTFGVQVSSFIRNAHPDALMLVSEKIDNSHLRKMYLVGQHGPVMRAKSEAHQASDEMKQRYLITK